MTQPCSSKSNGQGACRLRVRSRRFQSSRVVQQRRIRGRTSGISTFDPFSTRDATAEDVDHTIDSPTGADDDVMLDKENKIDDDQESEEIADETVNAPTPKRRTRIQGKKTLIIPEAASPSDLEDEPTPSKHSISRTKARSKYLSSIQELFPKSPRQRKAKKPAANMGRGSV